jgi:hypothetical protein
MTGIINSRSPKSENNWIAPRMGFLDLEAHPELLLSMAPLGPPVHMLNVLTLKAGPGVVPERVFWVCGGMSTYVVYSFFLSFFHFVIC